MWRIGLADRVVLPGPTPTIPTMFTFATDYFLLVFVACVGVVQVAASSGRMTGLLIFKSPLVARTLGSAVAVSAFVWFFSTGTRNINDYEGGLDGPTQALFFFLGSFAESSSHMPRRRWSICGCVEQTRRPTPASIPLEIRATRGRLGRALAIGGEIGVRRRKGISLDKRLGG